MAVSSQSAPSTGGPLTLLRRLWRQVARPRRRQLALAVALMLVAGLFEMVSLAAVLPLMGLLLGPRGATGSGIAVLFALLLAGGAAVRLASFWCHTRLAAAVGSDFSSRAFRLLLAQPYAWHLHTRSGALVTTLAPLMRQLVQQVLLQALQLAGASLLLAGLLTVLLVIAWPLVLAALLVLVPAYLLLWRLLQQRLHANGRRVVEAQREQIELLQECLGGIRELILRGWQPLAVDRFTRLDGAMRHREAVNETLTGLPRYLIEPLGLILILVFGLVLQQQGRTPQEVVATLGLLAFAAQRLLPLSQQVWKAWSSLAGGQALIENLLVLLELPEPATAAAAVAPLSWRRDLRLEDIRFAYDPVTPPVLDGVELRLRRGEWLGVRGPSGCGKSTLLDVVMGLLVPQAGQLRVDGEDLLARPERLRAWQRGVATVAARSPLVAGSVTANILVGSDAGDGQRLAQVAEVTGIGALLEREVGDGGRGLSDGQRQRVAIARALFHGGSLLVLDEATAALDSGAEAELLGRLRRWQPDLAVILVSHRDGSLRGCDRIVTVGAG
jgi:ABC-type bacteriocin/lantibiotic exporter with double-glycine peptidase domain